MQVHSVLPSVVLYKALYGLVVAGVGALIMWPFRKARKEWVTLKDAVASTHAELVQQRTNCLQTLQNQGETQITLLTKAVDALDGVRLDLKEQTGYLMASAMPRRAPARAKK